MKQGIVLAVVMLAVAGCGVSDPPYTVEPPNVPFDDLFAAPDTIRLDTSVVVGTVSFLDVSKEGHFLIADEFSRSTYHFSASGKHIRTYLIGTCQPDHPDERVRVARFVGGGRILLVGADGAVAVLDESALCAATKYHRPLRMEAACATGDSVFMQRQYSPYHKQEAYAVTRDLEMLETWRIAKPEFPRLNALLKGFSGRSMACFADGPYYKYAGWPDAKPVIGHGSAAQVDPVFFTQRARDIGGGPDIYDRVDEINEYPTNSGIWAINSTTRMIVYTRLPKEWVPPNAVMRLGAAVVSNVGAFPARTAIPPFVPVGAAHGYIYREADPEILSDGDLGNPLILRYKFIPPPDANP